MRFGTLESGALSEVIIKPTDAQYLWDIQELIFLTQIFADLISLDLGQ